MLIRMGLITVPVILDTSTSLTMKAIQIAQVRSSYRGWECFGKYIGSK